MLGVRLLLTQSEFPGLLGPGALVEQSRDGGGGALQSLGFNASEVALPLVNLIKALQGNQAPDLSFQ